MHLQASSNQTQDDACRGAGNRGKRQRFSDLAPYVVDKTTCHGNCCPDNIAPDGLDGTKVKEITAKWLKDPRNGLDLGRHYDFICQALHA